MNLDKEKIKRTKKCNNIAILFYEDGAEVRFIARKNVDIIYDKRKDEVVENIDEAIQILTTWREEIKKGECNGNSKNS